MTTIKPAGKTPAGRPIRALTEPSIGTTYVADYDGAIHSAFWYNRQERSWVVFASDAEGHQDNNPSTYVYDRTDAELIADDLINEQLRPS